MTLYDTLSVHLLSCPLVLLSFLAGEIQELKQLLEQQKEILVLVRSSYMRDLQVRRHGIDMDMEMDVDVDVEMEMEMEMERVRVLSPSWKSMTRTTTASSLWQRSRQRTLMIRSQQG